MDAPRRARLDGTAIATLLLALLALGVPSAATAAVGDALRTIVPTAATTVDGVLVDPTCDSQGGTSMSIVQGSKLAGVDPLRYPVLLATSCLDNGGSQASIDRRSRMNFLDPGLDPVTGLPSGKVVKSIQTRIGGVVATPSNGWGHWHHRPDFADLIACGADGTIYTIDFDQFSSTPDGTATAVPRPAGLPANCVALAWDAEEDVIYQGVTGGAGEVGIHRFKFGTTTLLEPFFATPCTPSGMAVTGGALVVACEGVNTVLRLDKSTGASLSPVGSLAVLGLPAGTALNPDLGDLACDPLTFHKDPVTGKDRFRDAMWSRNGPDGNGAVALEFPAFTCGLPSTATVFAAGLSGSLAGACFDGAGQVIDVDDDGLPDCWETGGIDFDGDGVVDLQLCVPVDTNGDGVADVTECADPDHKDLFVEVDYMQGRKPDPRALSQTQTVASVGVQSVREAFAAAPVANPDLATGIRIHFQVDEQVTFATLAGTQASAVTELVFTPCTPPAVSPSGTQNAVSLADAAEFDTIKKANFGTAAERVSVNALNAKRLAFRYVLFANKQVGLNQGGAQNSGCAEISGDDAAVTLGGFANTFGQQAGTLMHEIGHTLGLRHGGSDNVNCKPNYRSVMSYSRQFADSPIPGRRLDYSRAEDPVLADLNKTGRLSETSLDEFVGLGTGLDGGGTNTLGPIAPFFPAADQIAFGPTAWSIIPATQAPINWNRNKFTSGQNKGLPIIEAAASGNLNQGSGGCDGSGALLEGHDDWSNLLYRFSAALDFAGGIHTESAQEMTKEQEEEFFLAADLDANGIADAKDCGTHADGTAFVCTHRIDIKPSFGLPKTVNLGAEATVSAAIFSEVGSVWDAPAQVLRSPSLTLSVGSVTNTVKVNSKGQGTCSVKDAADPNTGVKDGIKDLVCQFPTTGFPFGKHLGILSGLFLDPVSGEVRAFRARQEVIILP